MENRRPLSPFQRGVAWASVVASIAGMFVVVGLAIGAVLWSDGTHPCAPPRTLYHARPGHPLSNDAIKANEALLHAYQECLAYQSAEN